MLLVAGTSTSSHGQSGGLSSSKHAQCSTPCHAPLGHAFPWGPGCRTATSLSSRLPAPVAASPCRRCRRRLTPFVFKASDALDQDRG
jgi:hypothetical protein